MSNHIILKCKNCLLTIHLYEEEEPIVRRVESTKEVDIYLNLIGKHKPEIHLSIKNMNINKIYKYMYTGVHLTTGWHGHTIYFPVYFFFLEPKPLRWLGSFPCYTFQTFFLIVIQFLPFQSNNNNNNKTKLNLTPNY